MLNKISSSYELNVDKTQFGFRKERSTTDAIFVLSPVINKCKGRITAVLNDLTAAYDYIPRDFCI